MTLINLFLVIIILYVSYKIIIYNENFNTTETPVKIDLTNKNIYGKNVFYGVDPDELEDYNKIEQLDLSKNNLIIDNTKNPEKIKINDKLCFGNNCINKENIELISGKVDGPKFYKDGKQIYYNHDCNKSSSKNKDCKITDYEDLPDKMCFVNGNNEECIQYNDLEVLDGERGMKLSHNYKNPEVYEGYVKPPYIYNDTIQCVTKQKPDHDYNDQMYNRRDWKQFGKYIYEKNCEGEENMTKCKKQCIDQQIRECKRSYLKENTLNGIMGENDDEKEKNINIKCSDTTNSIVASKEKNYIVHDNRYCMTNNNLHKGWLPENGGATEEDAKKACDENVSCTAFTLKDGKKSKNKQYQLHNVNVNTLARGVNPNRKCFVTYVQSTSPKNYIEYNDKYCITSKNIGRGWISGTEEQAKDACNNNSECTSFTYDKSKKKYELHKANAHKLQVGNNKNRKCFKSFIPIDRTNTYIGYEGKKCTGIEIGSPVTYKSDLLTQSNIPSKSVFEKQKSKIDEAIKMCDSIDDCNTFTMSDDNYQMFEKHNSVVQMRNSENDVCYRINNDDTIVPNVNSEDVTDVDDTQFYKVNNKQWCGTDTRKKTKTEWIDGGKDDAIKDCNESVCNAFTLDRNNLRYKKHDVDDITKLVPQPLGGRECYEQIYDVKKSQIKEPIPTSMATNENKNIKGNYIMPYYIDFKKTGEGIAGTKDQLLHKTAKKCSQSDGINSNVPNCFDCKNDAYFSYMEEQKKKLEKRRKIRDYTLKVVIPGMITATTFATIALAGSLIGPAVLWIATGIIIAVTKAAVESAVLVAEKTYKFNLGNTKIAQNIRNKWISQWLNSQSYFAPRKYPYYDNINTEYRASNICRNIKDTSPEVNYKGIPTKCFNPDTEIISNEGRKCPHTCKLTRKDMFGLKVNYSDDCHLDFNPSNTCLTSHIKNDKYKKHGHYILPYKEKTNENYKGYFVDKDNFNITNRLNKNGINMAAISKGTNDDHRASHNGQCGNKSMQLASDLFFCSGFGLKNHYKSEYDYRCNPAAYYDKKLVEKEACEARLKRENTFIKDIDQEEPDLSSCKIDELEITDDFNDLAIDTNFDAGKIKETNYFIKPALNDNGKLIENNTYFHGHNHVHINSK
jgi:hypothetical protein